MSRGAQSSTMPACTCASSWVQPLAAPHLGTQPVPTQPSVAFLLEAAASRGMTPAPEGGQPAWPTLPAGLVTSAPRDPPSSPGWFAPGDRAAMRPSGAPWSQAACDCSGPLLFYRVSGRVSASSLLAAWSPTPCCFQRPVSLGCSLLIVLKPRLCEADPNPSLTQPVEARTAPSLPWEFTWPRCGWKRDPW